MDGESQTSGEEIETLKERPTTTDLEQFQLAQEKEMSSLALASDKGYHLNDL